MALEVVFGRMVKQLFSFLLTFSYRRLCWRVYFLWYVVGYHGFCISLKTEESCLAIFRLGSLLMHVAASTSVYFHSKCTLFTVHVLQNVLQIKEQLEDVQLRFKLERVFQEQTLRD